MQDTLYDGRPFRTLNVIDEGNREALRIEVGTSISAARVVRVMNELVECTVIKHLKYWFEHYNQKKFHIALQ